MQISASSQIINKRDSNINEVNTTNESKLEEVTNDKATDNLNNHSIDYPLWERIFARILTLGSIFLTPLYAYFLYVACDSVNKEFLKETELDAYLSLNIALTVITSILVIMNTVSDATAVNPIEEAEDLLENIHSSSLLSVQSKMSVSILTRFNQIVAFPSFFVLGAADAIAVAYLVPQLSTRLCIGIPVTILDVVYYYMFSGQNLRKHAAATINQVVNCCSVLKNIYKGPARFLETNLQVISNIIYRSIAAGYTMDQILQTLFEKDETDPISIWVISSVMIITAYVTAQSRILQVYDNFFNEKFNEIPPIVFKNTSADKTQAFSYLIISLTRTVPLAVIFNRHSIFENRIANIGFSISIAGIMALHNFYALYQTHKFKNALQSMKLDLQKNENQTSTQLFQKIANYYKTNSLENITGVINFGARIGRWIAFIGFIISLQQILEKHNAKLPFDFYDTICLAALWGIPTLAADGKVYQAEFRETWSYYRAKIEIGLPQENKSEQYRLVRVCKTFFTPKKHYNNQQLKDVIDKLNEDRGEKTPLLINWP